MTGAHLPAAYAPRAPAAIARMTVEATTDEHEAAPRLLGVPPSLGGTVVAADAMLAHADVRAAARQRRGECVLHAKKNQAGLRRDIEAAFTAAEGGEYSPPHPAAVG